MIPLQAGGPMLTRSAFLALSLSFSKLFESIHPQAAARETPPLLSSKSKNGNTDVLVLIQPAEQQYPFLSISESSVECPELFNNNNNDSEHACPERSNDNKNYSSEEDFYATQSRRIRLAVSGLLEQDPTMAGPLIRLAFHDATTWDSDANKSSATSLVVGGGGPNGSIQYELERIENRALSKPLKIVQTIQQKQQQQQHQNLKYNTKIKNTTYQTISLADTIALAGAAAVEYAGGPHIPLRMGRTDATGADPYFLRHSLEGKTKRSKVTSSMPSAALDSDGLRLYFGERLGLREEEWVALSGVHGLGRHVTLLGMPKSCFKNLTRTCLEEAPGSLPFVTSSVDRFSNEYFQYLLRWNKREINLGDAAFIPTDIALVVDAGLRKHVQRFARDEKRYERVFSRAYQTLTERTAITNTRY